MTSAHFDLAAIGSGPAGQKAALAAAKLGKRVAVIDDAAMLGGVCLHTGTIPSKTLREAVLYLTGMRQRAFYGEEFREVERIRPQDLAMRVREVVERQRDVIHDQLERNDVAHLDGHARFLDAHTLVVEGGTAAGTTVTADHVLIASGTRPARREDLPFESPEVIDADDIILPKGGELAKSLAVIGAGVIGMEYASMAAALGVEVTVVEARDTLLDFVDHRIIGALVEHLESLGTTFCLNEKVAGITVGPDGARIELESGATFTKQRVLYAVGRQPNTDRLGLDTIDLGVDPRGRIEVNDRYQTAIPHIYAAGDVIGFPALASTSMEQGRIAACHMFGAPFQHSPDLLPYGIYTIPEISMVGRTPRQLTEDGVPHEIGIARYEEIARAQIIGDRTGVLALVFHPETLEILSVHIIGEGAAELVHIGLAAMVAGGTLESIRDIVFNYPTLAEAYKVAAMDGLNKVSGVARAAGG
jgi:NAD(P) transhydrogenase